MSTEDNAPAAPQDQNPAPQDPTPQPAREAGTPERPRPRTGPIVWGCLILAFCAYIVQRTFAPGTVDVAFWITGTAFGLGALLLGVGIAIVARSARRR